MSENNDAKLENTRTRFCLLYNYLTVFTAWIFENYRKMQQLSHDYITLMMVINIKFDDVS